MTSFCQCCCRGFHLVGIVICSSVTSYRLHRVKFTSQIYRLRTASDNIRLDSPTLYLHQVSLQHGDVVLDSVQWRYYSI